MIKSFELLKPIDYDRLRKELLEVSEMLQYARNSYEAKSALCAEQMKLAAATLSQLMTTLELLHSEKRLDIR